MGLTSPWYPLQAEKKGLPRISGRGYNEGVTVSVCVGPRSGAEALKRTPQSSRLETSPAEPAT